MARAKKTRSASPKARKPARKPAAKAQRMKAAAPVAEDMEFVAPPEPAEAPLTLPDCLDADASIAVKDTLLQRRGKPLVIDASQVRRVGAQSLQILISAARTWRADGLSYSMTNPSTELLETLALVGLPLNELNVEGMTP